MSEHYNAFISYKHEEVDTKIAKEVQRNLENFRIPERIQQKTGVKKIEKVFRDTDELSLTSNLSETITEALLNTDYLIVICSPKTSESEWVLKEINFFLEHHSRDHIFTVIVDGEPSDVVPDILQYDENGNNTEPLSCDYRMNKKIANKVELPRLVSAIIGCSYNELMNRQRVYYIRHMIRVASTISIITLLFLVMLIVGIVRINQNYTTAITNQSKYLSKESETLLTEDDRMTAILLALEALPKSPTDRRPITSEAIKALTNATDVYSTSDADRLISDKAYRTADELISFEVSPGGRYIAALTAHNVFYIFETSTGKCINYISISDYLTNYKFISSTEFITISDSNITLWDISKNELKWQYEIDTPSFCCNFMLDKDNNAIKIVTIDGEILSLNLSDGKEVKKEKIPKNCPYGINLDVSFSPSNDKMIFEYYGEDETVHLACYDIKSRKVTELDKSEFYIRSLYFPDDKTLVVSRETDAFEQYSSDNEDLEISNSEALITCYDIPSGDTKWNTTFTYNSDSPASSFISLSGLNRFAFFSGNEVAVYNADNGKEFYSYNVNYPIIGINDDDNDGIPTIITENGYTGNVENGEIVHLKREYGNHIQSFVIDDAIYIMPKNERKIIRYEKGFTNPSWHPIDNIAPQPLFSYNYFADGEYFIIITYEEESFAKKLLIIDESDYSLSREIPIQNDSIESDITMLGIYDETFYFVHDSSPDSDNIKLSIGEIDLETGDVSYSDLPNYSGKMGFFGAMDENVIAYINYTDSEAYCLNTINLDTDEEKTIPLPLDDSVFISKIAYNAERNLAYISSNKNDVIVNTDDETTKVIEGAGTDSANDILFSDDDTIIKTSGEKVEVMGLDGRIRYEVSKKGNKPISSFYYKRNKSKRLLVVYSNDLCIYDASNGKLLDELPMSMDNKTIYRYEMDYEEELLYIISDRVDIVSTKDMVILASIEYSLDYCKDSERFLTIQNGEDNQVRIGYIKHYSPEELIEIGKEMTDGLELTDRQKAEYGIGS